MVKIGAGVKRHAGSPMCDFAFDSALKPFPADLEFLQGTGGRRRDIG
jgi:hypothetical protein